jgi:diguanylate cyclase (GGDEF)-like protein/PAS domain S-box-containing protein
MPDRSILSNESPPPAPRSVRAARQRLAVLLCAALLVAEFVAPGVIAVTILYSIPVLMASRTGDRRFTFSLATVSTLAALAGLAVTRFTGERTGVEHFSDSLDEFAATLAIWAAATLGLRRTSAEVALRAARAVSEVTLDTITEAVISVDNDERITYVNRAAMKLLGYESREALTRPLQEVFRVDEGRLSGDDSVIAEGPSLFGSRAQLLRTRGGARIPVDTDSIAIRDDAGNVRGRVIVCRDASDRQRYEGEIKRLAYRDELTLLPNRASFWDRLQLELAHAERDRKQLGLLYIDLDGVKAVNVTLGHRAGDALLRGVAERLRKAVRRGDTVARLGGDEFTVILPGLRGAPDAERVAEKLVKSLEEPIPVGEESIRARPSIGIAIYPQDAIDAEDLVHCADQAMYEAKQGGPEP